MNPIFVKPRYDSGGFAGLPTAILSAFGPSPTGQPNHQPHFAGEYDNIIFCFIDGFGWRHFEKFGAHPFLARSEHVAITNTIEIRIQIYNS